MGKPPSGCICDTLRRYHQTMNQIEHSNQPPFVEKSVPSEVRCRNRIECVYEVLSCVQIIRTAGLLGVLL